MADQKTGGNGKLSPFLREFIEVMAKFGAEIINDPSASQEQKLEIAKSVFEDVLKETLHPSHEEPLTNPCMQCFNTFKDCTNGHQQPYQVCWSNWSDCKRRHGCQ